MNAKPKGGSRPGDFTHPTVKPRLTMEQLELLLAHIFRIPDLFVMARQQLKPELFNSATEPHYGVLWRVALAIVKEKTPDELFSSFDYAYSILEVEIDAKLKAEPALVNEEYFNKIFSRDPNAPGLLYWIYKIVTDSELKFSRGVELLKCFRQEREVYDALKKTISGAGDSVLGGMPEFLQKLKERYAEINATDDDPVSSGAPVNYFPAALDVFPTNITFLDPLLHGGHAHGEVYGVLGAYGSGKTCLAVQLLAAGALYQQTQRETDHDYVVKEWYLFSYEATKDELIVRLWSEQCTIAHERLEKAKGFEHLSSIANGYDSLLPYEKHYFASQKKADPTVPAKGERERLMERLPAFRENLWLLDMTGGDLANPKRGSGYVPEIATIIENDLRRKAKLSGRKHEVGGVIIDYAGLVARRHINEKGYGPEMMRHLIGEMPHECKRQIACPYHCPVWIFHQLNTQAQKRTALATTHYSDAAEAGNFAENVVFCMQMGTKDKETGAFQLNISKGRRMGCGKPVLLMIEPDFYRVCAAEHLEIDPSDGKIWPKNEYHTIAKHQTNGAQQTHHYTGFAEDQKS